MNYLATMLLALPAVAVGQHDLTHLPQPVADEIVAWRNRLATADCLYVALDTDQTWSNLHELDAQGSPTLSFEEHFHTVAWMTPDSLWMAIYPPADHAHPLDELVWQNDTVWERWWSPDDNTYHTRRYTAADPNGPTDAAYPTHGCIYASSLSSWLVGPQDLSERDTTVRTIALMRGVDLAIVPPDPDAPGVWLDVIDTNLERDSHPEPDSLYRRNDFMRLARNDAGEPELREWRTIVMTDSDSAAQTMSQIVGISRFHYDFRDTLPAPAQRRMQELRTQVDTGVDAGESD